MLVLQRYWFKCIDCGREYEASERIYFCPSCGGLLDVEYEYDRRLSLTPWSKSFRERPLGVWRYRELLPIEELDKVVTMNEGGTRLIRCRNLERDLGI
ncbi:MAG: hypothetical protein J7K49_07040, partial [Thaumarchaeota archaeon]|nr:hypothetical protein [Nitrososphaerota archaeon]